jgi:hypothetical protein
MGDNPPQKAIENCFKWDNELIAGVNLSKLFIGVFKVLYRA